MRRKLLSLTVMGLSLAAPLGLAAQGDQRPAATISTAGLRQTPTAHYTIYSDLSDQQLEEVIPRIERMASEYQRRTAYLASQKDDRRLPFYLFSRKEDYVRAGGSADSAGTFDGERLLAVVGDAVDERAWHVIQHEAFHQHLMARLGTTLPIWLNEGMAEYFGESLFTGDGFVSGVVPAWRLERVRKSVAAGETLPLIKLLAVTHEVWNREIRLQNYDEVWALVQFLAHADNGRYQDGLVRYLQATAKGQDPLKSFRECIGEPDVIEKQWMAYLQDFSDSEGNRVYGQVAAQTIASYLARANLSRQTVNGYDHLLDLAKANNLEQPRTAPLPASLLLGYASWAGQLGLWEVDSTTGATLRMKDGTRVVSKYILRGVTIASVESWVEEPGQKSTGKASNKRNRRPQ